MYIVNACMGKWWQCSPLFILGFTLSMGSQAIPQIDAVSGSFTQNGTLTIRGSAFSTKAQAKPLFFWEADGGEEPSSLGRKLTWGSGFNGDVVDATDPNAEIAPGSTKVAQYHIAREDGSMLGKVSFDTGETYIWRKRRDGFDSGVDYAVQMTFDTVSAIVPGSTIQNNLIMASADKVVWGQIQWFEGDTGGYAAYFSNKAGNIGEFASKDYLKFVADKTIHFYAAPDTDLATPLMSAQRTSGYGYLMALNHKSIRIWADYGSLPHSIVVTPCFTGSARLHSGGIALSHLGGRIVRCGEWTNWLQHPAHKWTIEEFEYKAGSVDIADSIMRYSMDGLLATDELLVTRTADNPQILKDIFQFQAPHSAQLGSYEYFDSLYVDDSRHRVIICDSPTYSACENPEVQIPKAWSNGEIQISARLKAFRNVADSDKVSFQDLYLYVADGNSNINENGMNLCIDCIKAPVLSGKASAISN